MKTHGIRIHKTGGPDVLQWEEYDLPAPGPHEVQIEQKAAGLNFIEVYHRTGLYALPLPTGLGQEGAGVVTAVGANVTEFKVGDRLAYANGPPGSYALHRNLPAANAVPLPDGVGFDVAAAAMLKGLTAWYLLRRTHALRAGETILFHAAAGGVGLIACQWAKALGATVIGTVGREDKAKIARAHGCDHVIVTGPGVDVAKQVRAITNGAGVRVAYDGVGRDTYMASLDSLAPLGMMVAFGNASGPIPPIDPLELSKRGSLFFTRPTLFHYVARREDLLGGARDLFAVIASGQVKIEIGQTYKMQNAAQAQSDLEARKTVGSTVLVP